MTTLFGLFFVLLAGCTQAIIMGHPDGRTANCGSLTWLDGSYVKTAPVREAQCIRDFKEQGFARQP